MFNKLSGAHGTTQPLFVDMIYFYMIICVK